MATLGLSPGDFGSRSYRGQSRFRRKKSTNYRKRTHLIKNVAFSFVLLLNLMAGSWAFASSYSVIGPGNSGQQTFVDNGTIPQSYQYQATVFIEGNQNFEYYCGGPYNGGDIIYRYVDGGSNDVPIFQRSSSLDGADYHHSCAPSVIFNPYVGNYQLYYECSPRGFPYLNPQQQVEAFTQICMAVSWDKSTFMKIAFGTSGNIYGSDSPSPIVSPVETDWQCGVSLTPAGTQIYFSQPGQSPCPFAAGSTTGAPDYGIGGVDFRYHYGTGHPSAVIAPMNPTQPPGSNNPNLVWLFYYDSQGWNPYGMSDGRTFILKSYDGYHFFRDSAGNLVRTATNFGPGPMNVKYDSVNRHFIALVPYPDGHIVLNYTTPDNNGVEDGTNWKWTTGIGNPPDPSLTIQTNPDYRVTAGTPTFISFNDGSLPGVSNTTVIVAGEKPAASYSASVPGSHLYVNPEAIKYSP